jgi:hypothetical protein
VFDWSDIHRSVAQATSAYKLVCEPRSPVLLEALPAAIQAVALATPIVGAPFENATELLIKPGTAKGRFAASRP